MTTLAQAADWPRLQRAVEGASEARAAGRLRRVVHRVWPASLSLPPAIYVMAFHSVVDRDQCQPWEAAYDKGAVTTDALASCLEFLAERTVPLSLSEALSFVGRTVDRPYLVLTFDDGYRNTRTNAAPVLRRFGYRPAVFVNGAFADGGVYYRVLAAMLTKSGHAAVLAEELRRHMGSVDWSGDPLSLFNQTKDEYTVPGLIEDATEAAFRRACGDPAALRVHLRSDDVAALVALGWEVGNHTYRHDVLSQLDRDGVADAIEVNERYWAARGIQLLRCVAVPNGAARHVGAAFKAYLDQRVDLHTMFCNGGVNFRPSRTEWLRIPMSALSVVGLASRMSLEVSRSREASRAVHDGR